MVSVHDGRTLMKVRDHIYGGSWNDSPLKYIDDYLPEAPTSTYRDHKRAVTNEKMANMSLVYNRYISPRYRPVYLPPPSYYRIYWTLDSKTLYCCHTKCYDYHSSNTIIIVSLLILLAKILYNVIHRYALY